ncbi:MAG: sugar phosphate nucleotidyltransferase [Clostridia bacterium]
MKKPVLTILAAGMGSRYGGLKQMDPMDAAGNFIIDFDIYDALRAGFEDVIFIIKHATDADFRESIGRRIERRANVTYAYQELDKLLPVGFSIPECRVKPWGTTHAVICAREAIAGRSFAIINADDYYGPAAFGQLYNFLTAEHDKKLHALVGYNIENTLTEHGSVARGLCEVDKNGYLTDIRERTKVIKTPQCAAFTEDGEVYTDVPAGTTVSMNCWGFNNSIMDELDDIFARSIASGAAKNPEKYEDLLPNAVRMAMRDDKAAVKVLNTPDRWFGVTYQQDKPMVSAAIQALKDNGRYSANLWD